MAETMETRFYQIHLQGHLSEHLRPWFDDLTITNLENGDALLSGWVIDQAALHGLLNRIRDLGMPLLAVNSAPKESSDEHLGD